MTKLLITPTAAKLLRTMVVSCGSINCFETMRLLDEVKSTTDLEPIAKIEGYGYRLKAFERIYRFAEEEQIDTMDVFEMAWYFGSDLHIQIMAENAGHAGLSRFLGPSAGLITHVLLPLKDEETYKNGGKSIKIKNAFYINKDEPGVPCFHLGLIVNVPISKEEVEKILEEQKKNEVFMENLRSLSSEVTIPNEYFQALNCLADAQV